VAEPTPNDESPNPPWYFSWKTLIGIWVVILVVQWVTGDIADGERIPYSDFRTRVENGEVAKVRIGKELILGEYKTAIDGNKGFTTIPVEDEGLLELLRKQQVEISGAAEKHSPFMDLLAWVLPLILFVMIFSWLLRRSRGGGPGLGLMTGVGRSKARLYAEKDVGVTFEDVAGVDEAKAELQEVIEFLKTPEKFQRLGGKLPKGILLVGPPGTGKTLLARAVAGESGVPFFSISGSEFVEMFVGVGAARVRDLFAEAKKKAPCIIFVDELDALGKARGLGPNTHEEREQTLNQLLVELDGFDPRVGIVLMAATNRPEILDPALLRAGRFDRHVVVDRPDKGGRLAILKLHASKITLAKDADLDAIASMTAGFAGADLANIINEAALLAVRRDKDEVTTSELSEAVERVIAGLEKKNRVLSADEKQRVAHHELGHALVARLVKGADPVRKISIIPRGIAALGYTLQLPTEDRFLRTKSELQDRIAVLLGGRVAEELIYGDVSTGAQDDLRKATDIARNMVETYGMSELGEMSMQRENADPFLGGAPSRTSEVSEATAREADEAVRRIMKEQHDRACQLLSGAREVLEAAAVELVAKETLDGDELEELVAPFFES
jgi:cell division protease FtsH